LKTLLSLLVALLFAAPLSAEQALILTEIEQIQEKIWYLQRDLAAQKSTTEKQQQAFSRLTAKTDKQQRDLETHSATMAATLASQQESLQRLDATVQSLKESVTTLINEFNQQNSAQLQQAEKAGAQEGLIRAMREEFAANRKQTEQALAETQKQLAETRAELAALQTDESGQFNQLILWGGGIALGLSILLTIVLACRSGGSRKTVDKREFPTKHEL
jgi:septal ring factor EnvC (AmiA/AmiB activator)